ncbi:tail fiber domain-containing protein [Niabella sp. CC-SYL272]|uniref:tail fiber domain-containing protein n=1 Tax=Niabella agricola TaxID=2891571 RepID=UPI001F2EA15A|nr:tail fiber domain-containing protein [Niabella agricola]MCF3109750.1 tail fiber domain-containing protein [Niabella agricola]
MKLNLFLLLLLTMGWSVTATAQVPTAFAFQGVARNTNGQAAANKTVSVRFTIHQGAETGGQVFQETHNPTTNGAGVFNVAIGSKSAGTFQDMFQNINWSNAVAYYLQVEIDPAGGSSFTTISTTQLLSVPYAFAAGRLVAQGSTVLSYTGTTIGSSSNKALASEAVAIGYNAEASALLAFAAGKEVKATGIESFAMGSNVEATAGAARAFGFDAHATGTYSTALGNNVTTNSFKGSFIIGDYRPSWSTGNTAENQMAMRFGGGYRFYTGTAGNGFGIGVSLDPNGNSWASISDSTKKENYSAANGSTFLSKIKGMKLGSWNYKGQNKQLYRHYGPMAQEFHSLFGNDGVGIIGNDTTIAGADIDGVMMIALQTLAKQTETLQHQVKQLAEANKKLQQRVAQLAATKKEH